MITKQVDGHKYEPFEEAVIEVPEEHVGPVVDMLGQRKGQMLDLIGGTDTTSLTRLVSHRCVKHYNWWRQNKLAELTGCVITHHNSCLGRDFYAMW